jgi:hypothetical protein
MDEKLASLFPLVGTRATKRLRALDAERKSPAMAPGFFNRDRARL